jgi:alpha-D-ribose 1-methylphosphonate 5-triphosphate diphosphatase
MWVTDARLVLPDQVIEHGALRLEGGRIVEIREGDAPGAAIHAGGLMILPGLIDVHGDMLERDMEPRPKVRFPVDLVVHELDKRLAATGITTAFAAISLDWPGTVTRLRSSEAAQAMISAIHDLRPSLLTDFLVHVRFEITVPQAGEYLTAMLEADEVHLVSLTDHTPGQGQYRDIEKYIRTMREWHQEKEGLHLTDEDMRQRIVERTKPVGWQAVNDVARIARERHVILASHDDDTEEKVALMAGLGSTISEFPVSLEAAEAARTRGMHVVMGAPNALRGASHSGNLSALDGIEAGVVDTLASDYFPAAMLHAALAVAERGLLSLPEAVRLVTLNPADGVGLSDRGALEVGRLADLVLVETTPGRRARVRATFRHGTPIFWDRHMAELNDGLMPRIDSDAPSLAANGHANSLDRDPVHA